MYFLYRTHKKQSLKQNKLITMKQAIERILRTTDKTEKFHAFSTIFMILLFLTFWGVSFYVLVNSFA